VGVSSDSMVFCEKDFDHLLVQILVLVATIQTRLLTGVLCTFVYIALKAVVEKVSLTLANRQGSVGPKSRGNPLINRLKGSRLIFLHFRLGR